eukprot:scaffold1018_cov420-Prasinococcus_capsulatus_cf.AAC.7
MPSPHPDLLLAKSEGILPRPGYKGMLSPLSRSSRSRLASYWRSGHTLTHRMRGVPIRHLSVASAAI